ncbi:hypothetical protein EDB81DRAFT_830981 [Dactylonectria macrodidyma]|uniref:NmrA-like domain-containing protein n=1 Tax=Dactylonectria macrodidyma TaxID=307937 RepID=A0A9P9I8Z7_9HYPO|nr:hypothetical protein EDB81DRAFT_830981 [Dactylonectria macrodidyma]
MALIKNVTVVGATGNVGPHIISALLERSFQVTALTRTTSSHTFPPRVTEIKTDYTPSSLERAFQGQDAVICTLGYGGLEKQLDLVDAAEKAGVKRFIPSEFGSPKGKNDIPEYTNLLQNKLKVVQYLQQKAEKNPQFSWSAFTTGTFLDRALLTFPDFGFDVRKESATIFDSGNEPFTAMTIQSIGKPVVASLDKFDETKNRYIGISSLTVTQNEVLAAFEKQLGRPWNVTRKDTKEVLAEAKQKMAKGDFKGGYVGFMIAQMFEDNAGRAAVDGRDNLILGTPQETLEDLVKLILSQI